MTSKTKRVLTEISKYKVYKLHETYLKEEFPCIYRKFLLRSVVAHLYYWRVKPEMRHDFRPAAILDGPTFRSDTIDLYWKISIF